MSADADSGCELQHAKGVTGQQRDESYAVRLAVEYGQYSSVPARMPAPTSSGGAVESVCSGLPSGSERPCLQVLTDFALFVLPKNRKIGLLGRGKHLDVSEL